MSGTALIRALAARSSSRASSAVNPLGRSPLGRVGARWGGRIAARMEERALNSPKNYTERFMRRGEATQRVLAADRAAGGRLLRQPNDTHARVKAAQGVVDGMERRAMRDKIASAASRGATIGAKIGDHPATWGAAGALTGAALGTAVHLTQKQLEQRRAAGKASAEKRRSSGVEKAAQPEDLMKAWQTRLPAILAAIHAAHGIREAGGHEPAMVDSTAAARLAMRAARLAREYAVAPKAPPAPSGEPPFPPKKKGKPFPPKGKGEADPETAEKPSAEEEPPAAERRGKKPPPFAKVAVDPGEILAKSAPREIREAFDALDPSDQTDVIMAGAPLLAAMAELDARLATAPFDEHYPLVKAWVAERSPEERELCKFWGLAARGAMAAAPMVGRVAGAVGRGIGTLGPKLSRLFGVGQAARVAAAGRQAGAARAAGTWIPPMPGTPGAAKPSMGYRAMRAGRAGMGYAARGARGVGSHLYNNRGAYGATAGWELGTRYGADRGD